MYESLTQHCCNFINKQCLGAFFKFDNGILIHRVYADYANKPCRVSRGEYCEWFERIVIPGVKKTDKNLALIERWKRTIGKKGVKTAQQSQSTGYKRKCRKCHRWFWADSYNRLVCDDCIK